MKLVNVAELKQRLSHYLHTVEEGEEVVVTSHSRKVARLVREDGKVEWSVPVRDLSALEGVRGVKIAGSRRSSDLLREDRTSR